MFFFSFWKCLVESIACKVLGHFHNYQSSSPSPNQSKINTFGLFAVWFVFVLHKLNKPVKQVCQTEIILIEFHSWVRNMVIEIPKSMGRNHKYYKSIENTKINNKIQTNYINNSFQTFCESHFAFIYSICLWVQIDIAYLCKPTALSFGSVCASWLSLAHCTSCNPK